MKPLIGVTTNYSYDDEIGIKAGLGGKKQEWQLIADDYIAAIEAAGGIPVIIPILENQDLIFEMIERLDGVVFTGGNDIDPQYYGEDYAMKIGELVPERDYQEIELMKRLISEKHIPILGICRGLQVLNVALGGSIYSDLESVGKKRHMYSHSPTNHGVHKVRINEKSLIKEIYSTDLLTVNSYHHQAINKLSDSLMATAISEDGLIEAVEVKSKPFCVAVQWHPEMMISKYNEQLKLFKSLVNAAERYYGGKK